MRGKVGGLTSLDSDLTDAQDLICFAKMFSISGEGVSCTQSTHQNVGELVDAEGSQRGGKVVMCAHEGSRKHASLAVRAWR